MAGQPLNPNGLLIIYLPPSEEGESLKEEMGVPLAGRTRVLFTWRSGGYWHHAATEPAPSELDATPPFELNRRYIKINVEL